VRRLLLASLAFLLPIVVVFMIVLMAESEAPSTAEVAGVTHTFEIPKGTADRMKKGLLSEEILPEQYTINRGDTIVVVNRDVEIHTFGPFTVRPGETQRMTFGEPGYYFGACTVGDHETVTITVV